MNNFTIKDLENLSGIKAHTIRIWEQRYSLIKPSRTETNIRYYSNKELKMLLNISILNRYGFKISHINNMSENEMNEKILSLDQKDAQHERIINTLITHMADLNIDKFEDSLDSYILARGIEKTVLHIIFPFLEKIGILWLTNHINPVQEHIVTNVIRQKIIVGIEGIVQASKTNKKVLLFLPEGEYHELGLLFLHYVLKNKGVSVIYLGSNIPLSDLEYIVNQINPDYLYTHLTSVANNFDFDNFLHSLNSFTKNKQVVISGNLVQSIPVKKIRKLIIIKSFAELNDFIASLLSF